MGITNWHHLDFNTSEILIFAHFNYISFKIFTERCSINLLILGFLYIKFSGIFSLYSRIFHILIELSQMRTDEVIILDEAIVWRLATKKNNFNGYCYLQVNMQKRIMCRNQIKFLHLENKHAYFERLFTNI